MAEEPLNNQVPQSAPGIPESRFEYVPIQELQLAPDLNMFRDDLDPQYLTELTKYAQSLNTAIPPATANLNLDMPSTSIGSFDPMKQQLPADPRTQSGLNKIASDALNYDPISQGDDVQPLIMPNAYASRDLSSFDRYYSSEHFNDLGWHPYANNEEYYNANTTIWDDMTRMRGQWSGLLQAGFESVYRSIGDLFDNDPYFSHRDVKAAKDFERAMAIGNSTRGGAMGLINNTLLQSGYTFGILASIAVEELAIGLGTAASGGTLAAPGAVKTGLNIKRAASAAADLFSVGRAAKATRNMLRNMRTPSAAKGTYQGLKRTGTFAADFIMPQTAAAIRSWNTTANAAQNISNMAKMSRTFGGFYRDLRALNYAVAEGKMEAGMVYNEQLHNGYAKLKAQKELEGEQLTEQDLLDVEDAAHKASYYTAMSNWPVIYATNQLLLGNALGGFNKSIGRMLQSEMNGLAKRVVRVKPKINPKTGKFNKDVFQEAKGIFGKTSAAYKRSGLYGVAGVGARGVLSYAAMNVGEGLQEVYQEAVAVAAKDYFTKVLLDPSLAGQNAINASIISGVDSQISERGFETFMSGFLMGGIVRGPQQVFFQGIPNLYSRFADNQTWKAHQDARQEYIDRTVDAYNKAWNTQSEDPNALFDLTRFNFVSQVRAAADMNSSIGANEIRSFQDARDYAKFSNLYTLFSTGGHDIFREQLEDFQGLTDEELNNAFPGLAVGEAESGKLRSRIADMITQHDRMKIQYDENVNKYPNKFDPSQYKQGTREFVMEMLKYKAFEHARYIKMFADNSFQRSVERQEAIFNELSSDPILKNVAANDITLLLNRSTIESEILNLTLEVDTLSKSIEGKDDAASKQAEKTLDKKFKKLEKLEGLYSVMRNESPEKITKEDYDAFVDGGFSTLSQGNINYLADKIKNSSKLTKQEEAILNDSKVMDAVNKKLIIESTAEKVDRLERGSNTYARKLRGPFKEYLDVLAEEDNSFVDSERIDEVLNKIVDYDVLSVRAKAYDKTIQYLTDPSRLDEMADQMVGSMEDIFNEARKYYKQSVEEFASQTEINEFLNQLDKIGVYPIPEEVKAFIKSKNVDDLQTFYAESGIVTPDFNAELFEKVTGIKEAFRLSQKPVEAEETEAEVKKRKKTQTKEELDEDIADILAAEGADGVVFSFNDKSNKNPWGNAMVNRLYEDYLKAQAKAQKGNKEKGAWKKTLGLKYIKSYEALKKVWISRIENSFSDEELAKRISFDTGFQTWLEKYVEEPGFDSIIEVYNVKTRELLPDYKETDIESSIREDDDYSYEGDDFSDDIEFDLSSAPGVTQEDLEDEPWDDDIPDDVEEETTKEEKEAKKKPAVEGQKYNIIEIPVTVSDSLFKIVTKSGKNVSDDILNAANLKQHTFNSLREATSALKVLDNLSEEEVTDFTFDGITLFRGQNVIKTKGKDKGKKYIVWSSPKDMEGKNAKLYLIPRDRAEELLPKSKASIRATKDAPKVAAGKFANNYKIDEGVSIEVPDNASKLEVKEAIGFYPRKLKTPLGTETPSQYNARTQFILEKLTEEDVDNLRIRVTRDPKAGEDRGYYNVNAQEEAANPLISKIRSPFRVEVLLPEYMIKDINEDLAESGLYYLEKDETVFEILGYLPVNNIKLRSKQDTEIDPSISIPEDDFYDIFKRMPGRTKKDQIEYVKKTFQTQYAFGKAIEAELDFNDVIEWNLKDRDATLPFALQLKSQFGTAKDKQERSLTELKHNTYRGETVILVNNFIPGSNDISTDVLTSLTLAGGTSASEQVKFKRQVLTDLKNAGLLEKFQRAGRYVGVIQTPGGQFTVAPLKTPKMENESLDLLLLDLFKRAALTINQNTNRQDGNYRVRNTRYNGEWNKEFNQRFYMATPSGYQLNLNATPSGSIELEIFDKKRKKSKKSNQGMEIVKLYINQDEVKEYAKSSANRIEFLDAELKKVKPNLQELFKDELAESKKKNNNVNAAWLASLKKAANQIDLSKNSFRKVFSKDAGTAKIIRNTVTNIDPRVRYNFGLDLISSGRVTQNEQTSSSVSLSVRTLKDSTEEKQSNEEFDGGENIHSKGSDFAQKLTNPGNDLKVEYKGKVFRNAEHAYQTWKSGTFDTKAFQSNAFKPVGSKPANRKTNYQTMVEILTAKLQQHPELVQGINQRGGLEYIENSTHDVTGDTFWETEAGQNKFIEALADAYKAVSVPSTEPLKDADLIIDGLYQKMRKELFNLDNFIDLKEDEETISKYYNENLYYRSISREGLIDALINGVLRQKGLDTGKPRYSRVWFGKGTRGFDTASEFADLNDNVFPIIAIVPAANMKDAGLEDSFNPDNYKAKNPVSTENVNFLTFTDDKAYILDIASAEKIVAEYNEEVKNVLREEDPSSKMEDLSLQQLIARRDEIKALLPGESKVQRSKRLKANEEYQEILKKINNFNKGSYKIVGYGGGRILGNMEDVLYEDAKSIETFIDYVAEKLPDFITVSDIATLETNLKEGFVPYGKFYMDLKKLGGGLEDLQGNIAVGARNRFKYHEAGHAVFRMLLTPEQQDAILKDAKKRAKEDFKTGNEEFDKTVYESKVRNHIAYFEAQGLFINPDVKSNYDILEKSFLEEYVMDQFEKFKQDPKSANVSSATKSWFTKLIEWIKSIFSFTQTTKEGAMQQFFKDIDSGKFRNYSAVDNTYTRLELNDNQELTLGQSALVTQGVTREAFKLIKIIDENLNQRYVNQQLSDMTSSSIAARTIDLQNENPQADIRDHIEQAIDEHIELYDSDKAIYNRPDFQAQRADLIDIENALLDQTEAIIANVTEYLKSFGVKVELIEEENDDKEQEIGLRAVQNYNQDASMLGGIENAPKEFRQWLSTIGLSQTDYFGNAELSPGVPIRILLDPDKGYTSILKAAMNETDPFTIVKKIYFYGKSNPNGKAISDTILEYFGITEEDIESGSMPTNIKRPNEFNRLIKTISNFKQHYNITQSYRGDVVVYSAFNKDEANSQINVWYQNNIKKRGLLRTDEAIDKVVTALDTLSVYLTKEEQVDEDAEKAEEVEQELAPITNETLDQEAANIASVLEEYVGISLSENFIKYSILDGALMVTDAEQLSKPEHAGQLEFYDSFTDVLPIKAEDISIMKGIIQGKGDLFVDSNEGMKSRMKRLSLRNAPFDENVGMSVFKNEEGNLVYGHQLPTYELQFTESLNDPIGDGTVIDELKKSNPFLERNFLLNSPFIKQMSRSSMFKVDRSGGSVVGRIEADDDNQLDIGRTREATTYGKQNGKQFVKNLIDKYLSKYEKAKGKVETVSVAVKREGKTIIEERALAPILTRIIETSNTGNEIPLPVIRAVENTLRSRADVTDEALDAVINMVITEFDSIQRESNPVTKTQVLIPDFNSNSDGLTEQRFVEKTDDEGNVLVDEEGKPIVEYNKAYKFYSGGAELILKPSKAAKIEERTAATFVSSENQVKRLRSGDQKIVVYSEAVVNKNIKFKTVDSVRTGLLSFSDETTPGTFHRFKSRGAVNVSEENDLRGQYITEFGDAISKQGEKDDTFKYGPIMYNNETYFSTSDEIRKFFSRKVNTKYYVYEVLDDVSSEPADDFSEIDNLDDLDLDSDLQLNVPFIDEISGAEFGTLRSVYATTLLERDRETGEVINIGAFTDLQLSENKQDVEKALQDNNIEFKIDKERLKNSVEIYLQQLLLSGAQVYNEIFLTTKPLKSSNDDAFSTALAEVFTEIRDERLKEEDSRKVEVDKYFKENGFADKLAEQARKAGAEGKFITIEEALTNIGSDIAQLRSYVRTRLDENSADWINYASNILDEEFSTFIEIGVTNIDGVETSDTDKANRLLNLSQNAQYNLKQIYLNDFINTTSWNHMVHGNPAMAFNGPVNEVKRAKSKNLAIKSIATSVVYPEAGIFSTLDSVDAIVTTEPINESTHSGKKIKEADAQMYGTLKFALMSFFGIGELNPAMLELLQKIERGEQITRDDYFGVAGETNGYAKLQAMLHSRKFAYSDGKTQAKMSVIILTPEDTSIETGEFVERTLRNGEVIRKPIYKANPLTPGLHNLREKMENHELTQELIYGKNVVSVAAPQSAFKTFRFNVNDINELVNTSAETNAILPENVMNLDPNYFGLQLVNPTNKEEITDPAQIKVLITNEQDDNTEVIIQGETLKVKDIRRLYNITEKEKLTANFTAKRNTIFNFNIQYATDELHKSVKQGALTEDLTSYLKYAQSSLIASQSSGQMLAFFDVDELLDKNYNLNSPITERTFAQLFLAYFKESLKQKIPGDSAALVSDYGNGVYRRVYSLDENGLPDRQEVIRDKVYQANYPDFTGISILEGSYEQGDDRNITESNLAQLIEESNGEGVIIIDRLRSGLKVYNDPKDEKSWTGERKVETKFTAPNKIIFDYINRTKELSSSQIERMFQTWSSTSNWSPKAGRNIVRTEIEDFDVNRSKEEYGAAFGFSFTRDESGNVTFNKQAVNLPRVFSKMFGVRIPSQDKHSAMNVEVVDFMPTFRGSTIMSARELIEISGADFDIDKMYLHMKQYFEQNGELIEYDNVWEHYVKYVNENVTKNNTYRQALFRAEKNGIEVEESDVFSEEAMMVLKVLNLPTTESQFDEYKEKHTYEIIVDGKVKKFSYAPYTAPMDNLILDLKFALLGNRAIMESAPTEQSIAHTPADTEAFEEAWDIFKTEFKELANLVNAEDLDSNTLRGKAVAFINNKSANIGSVVLPNQYLSLLSEYEVGIRKITTSVGNNKFRIQNYLRFNEVNFESFSSRYEKLGRTAKGRRVQELLSALITVMTDNAADQFAGKLNLNPQATSLAANMISMGVPLKTILRLINNPLIVRSYQKGLSVQKTKQDVAQKIMMYLRAFPDLVGKDIKGDNWSFLAARMLDSYSYVPLEGLEVTDDLLAESILKQQTYKAWDLEEELAERIDSGEITKEDALRDVNILNEWMKGTAIAQFTRQLSSLMNMSKGFGTSLENIRDREEDVIKLGLNLTDQEINRMEAQDKPLMDLRPIMRESFMGTYLDIHNEMHNSILPAVFLTETEMFKEIVESVTSNLKFIRSSDKSRIIRDVLSYLTIKAYRYERERNDPLSISRLSNDLVYSKDNSNIVKIINETKDILGDELNTFLDIFLVTVNQNEEGNKKGIYMAQANTFAKMTDVQRIMVQNDFVKLFGNPATRQNAIDILHYMMVKDGLQRSYQTLIGALTPEVLMTYFNQIDLVHDAFRNNKKDILPRLFGMSYDQIINDFALNYPMMSRSSMFVTNLKTGRDTLDIDIFNDQLPIKVSSRDITLKYVRNNPNTIFVVPYNEAGIGVSTYSDIVGLDNVVAIPYKRNNDDAASSYYKKSDYVDYAETLDTILKEDKARLYDEEGYYKEDLDIVFPKVWISRAEMKKYRKNTSKKVQAELDGALKTLGYNMKTGTIDKELLADITDIKNPMSVRTTGDLNQRIKSNPVYIDATLENPTLFIDPYKAFRNYENTSDAAVEKLGVPILTKEKFKQLRKLAGRLDGMGIKAIETKVKGVSRIEFKFPPVITYDFVGGAQAEAGGTAKTRFVLKAVRSISPGKSPLLFNRDNITRIGNYAEYVEEDVKGSYNVNPISFSLPGYIPTRTEVRQIISDANDTESNKDPLEFNIDDAVLPDEILFNGKTVEKKFRKITEEEAEDLESQGRSAEEVLSLFGFTEEELEDLEENEDSEDNNEKSTNNGELDNKEKEAPETDIEEEGDSNIELITNFYLSELTKDERSDLQTNLGLASVNDITEDYAQQLEFGSIESQEEYIEYLKLNCFRS